MYWIEKVYTSGVREALMCSEVIPFTLAENDYPFATSSQTLAEQVSKAINATAKNHGFDRFCASPVVVG